MFQAIKWNTYFEIEETEYNIKIIFIVNLVGSEISLPYFKNKRNGEDASFTIVKINMNFHL